MAEKLNRQVVAEKAIIHEAPAVQRKSVRVDRSFELPTGIYIATVSFYLGFLALMAVAFAHPELLLPMAMFTLIVAAGFGIPALWVRMRPENVRHAKSWSRFRAEGIKTGSGRSSAGAAAVQVLILPILIFAWGVAAVTIAVLVR